MKPRSPHIAFETLADLAEGRATAAERVSISSHLSACAACAGKLQRIEEVMVLMRTDKSEETPRGLVQYAINLFQPERKSSMLRRLVATLTFDSLTTAPAFGVRSGESQTRQLLFSAEENDIDLRITMEDEQWIVAGQVLRPDCGGGQVEISGELDSTSAELNELCEFKLPAVPPGNYLVRVRMAGLELEIPELELRRP